MRGLRLPRDAADRGFVARGTTSLRHLRPARFRRRRSSASVEDLALRIAQLQAERQALRARGASEAALERNRVQICRAQWELGHALIELYLPKPVSQTAA
jgi:hypothetical protein